jgi:hypothetical protein
MDEIRNKIAESGIITLDLNDYRPSGTRVMIDITEQLWQGIVLKEKDYREWIKSVDWTTYQGQHVAIQCSADAIVPSWAFMLLAAQLEPYASSLFFGDLSGLEESLYKDAIDKESFDMYANKRVMLKGCGDSVPTGSYLYLTEKLIPLVKSLMFGEPCSAVPVFKAKNS